MIDRRPSPEELLAGPRGRRLCAEVAGELSSSVHSALWHTAYRPGGGENMRRLQSELADLDIARVRDWQDARRLVTAVRRSVSSARGWQEPDDEDRVLAEPAVIELLGPLADAILKSAASVWWQRPLTIGDLYNVSFYHDGGRPVALPQLSGSVPRLARWREEQLAADRRAAARDDDLDANVTGCWWSAPTRTDSVSTSGSLPKVGPLGLIWQEDAGGLCDALVTALTVTGTGHVYEVDSPEAWCELVYRYPLEISASRRCDWYRVTGRDGCWLIPDFAAVAADFDAVHLTVAGYLTAATRALPVDGQRATLIAGWAPDESWWLTDSLTASSAPVHWHLEDQASVFPWEPVGD